MSRPIELLGAALRFDNRQSAIDNSPMPRAVVLLSGGLDSATVAAIAKERGFALHALTVNYGQRHMRELQAAGAVAKSIGVEEHIVQTIDLRAFGGSALTADIDVPKSDFKSPARHAERGASYTERGACHAERSEASPVREPSESEILRAVYPPRRAQDDKAPPARPREAGDRIPITYVPARNTIFLSFGLAYAEVIGAADIFIGVNAVDFSGYPDCRPAFIDAFERLANLATKAGVTGAAFKIHALLMEMSKGEIIREGTRLGVDYSLTHSCYDPAPRGLACGRCDSCVLRLEGFRQAGLDDPVRYVL